MRLGIDFGTTRTVVAASLDGRYAVASFDVDGDFRDYVPGLAVVAGGRLHLGWAAAAALDGTQEVESALRSIKRAVGGVAPDDPVPGLAGADVSALELTTRFLVHLKEMLVERSNLEIAPDEVLEATIAVPANATSRQRYLTLEAFTRAGFQVEAMVNEPTAAAVEFAQRNLNALSSRSPKRYVAVYDLGGGTFDTSAISLEGRRFELLVTEGIPRLGGDDFDELLLEAALEQAGIDPATLPPFQRTALLESCREAKEGLRSTSRRILIDLGARLPDAGEVVLDAGEVYDRVQPLIDRTVELVERMFDNLAAHGIDPSNPRELGGLYLVGGAISFPPVARTLRAFYKKKIQLAPQPHASTAVGLAIVADPEAEIYVREATTRHLGVWREGFDGREKVFDPILAKGALPVADGDVVVRRTYRPTHAVGHLRFVECGCVDGQGQPYGDLLPWKVVLFPYDPALADRADLSDVPVEPNRFDLAGQEIVETYVYGREGTVTVDIENVSAGYRRRYALGALG